MLWKVYDPNMDSARTITKSVRVTSRELVIITTHIHQMTVSATAVHSVVYRYLYFSPPLSYAE
jgi:hypothetical protein